MALKEDFEYATYRCVYCDTLNVARKSRPKAPKLSINQSYTQTYPNSSNSSSSESQDSGNILKDFSFNRNELILILLLFRIGKQFTHTE